MNEVFRGKQALEVAQAALTPIRLLCTWTDEGGGGGTLWESFTPDDEDLVTKLWKINPSNKVYTVTRPSYLLAWETRVFKLGVREWMDGLRVGFCDEMFESADYAHVEMALRRLGRKGILESRAYGHTYSLNREYRALLQEELKGQLRELENRVETERRRLYADLFNDLQVQSLAKLTIINPH